LYETVNFEAQRFGTSFDCVTEFAWNFGDGATATTTVPTITHTYTQPGSYVVSVTIKRPDVQLMLTRNLIVAADIPTMSTMMLWVMAAVILAIGALRVR
jgi:PKD repeat protein